MVGSSPDGPPSVRGIRGPQKMEHFFGVIYVGGTTFQGSTNQANYLFMAFQTLLCEGSPLCAGTAIIGIGEDRDTTTGSKETRNLYILRIHQLNKILHNSVNTILVEVTMTAETIKIKLQTLALYHLYIRNIADADLRKVRLRRGTFSPATP